MDAQVPVEMNHPQSSLDGPDDEEPSRNDESSSIALEHTLEPGDHVIRWEMLPIAYPIQIHGIVLEAGCDYVQIADFGLTTTHVDKNEEEEEEEPTALDAATAAADTTNTEKTTTTNKPLILDDAFSQKVEEIVALAREKLQRPVEKQRRLHVVTLRDQKELSCWKKINYGGNMLFGGGSGEGKNNNNTSWWKKSWGGGASLSKASSTEQQQENDNSDDASSCTGPLPPSTTTSTTEKTAKFVTAEDSNTDQQPSRPSAASHANDMNNSEVDQNASGNKSLLSIDTKDATDDDHYVKPKTTTAPEMLTTEANMIDGNKSDKTEELVADDSPNKNKSSSPHHRLSPQRQSSSLLASWLPRSTSMYDFTTAASEKGGDMLQRTGSFFASLRKSTSLDEGEKGINNKTTTATTTTSLKKRHMNPAMSNLLAAKQQQQQQQQPSPPPKLPKSDPTKLVLARTRFLLQHGEAVLPPYHVFYSNSECIAVFCKTGKWSTLQASVFLHSTAIGNAKSATAITLSVSAAAPLLAPAIAGLGIASVGMPWLILKKSKTKWEEAERTLTDLFWAQAEPEVFVACIENWSGLLCQKKDDVSN